MTLGNQCRVHSWLTMISACVLVCGLKLALVAQEEIYPIYAPHDNLLYARLAAARYWGYPYDANALVRPPAYPLWIAATRWLGIRHRIAAELLHLGSTLAIAIALRACGMRPWLAGATCAALALHRASFDQLNQLMREGFYAPVMLIALAVAILGIRRLPRIEGAFWLLLGFVLAILWHTREESGIIVCDVLVMLALCAWRLRRGGGRIPVLLRTAAVGVLVGAPIFACDIAVRLKTRSVHGVAVVQEVDSPPFRNAYCSLLSIAPPTHVPRVSLSRAAMDVAARESSAFGALKPFLDEGILDSWSKAYAPWAHVEGEVTGNGALWALRDAASAAGYHRSALTAAGFYQRLAREIKDAVGEGRIKDRVVPIPMVDPDVVRMLPQLPGSLIRVLRYFSLSEFLAGARELKRPVVPDPESAATLGEYERATLLNPDLIGGLTATVDGWVSMDEVSLASIRIEDSAGEILSEFSLLDPPLGEESPKEMAHQSRREFAVRLSLGRWVGRNARVVLVAADGRRWMLSLWTLLRRGRSQPQLGVDSACDLTIKHVGAIEPRARWRLVGQGVISATYLPTMLLTLAAGLVWLLVRPRHRRTKDPFWIAAAVLTCAMLGSRLLLLGVMDLAVFHVESRHVFPCLILAPVLIALLVEAVGGSSSSGSHAGER